jgi:hypothetical protein
MAKDMLATERTPLHANLRRILLHPRPSLRLVRPRSYMEVIMTKLRTKIHKADAYLEVELDNVSDAMYKKLIEAGLSHYLNRRMYPVQVSGLTGAALLSAQADALEIAERNLAELYSPTVPPNENPKLSACQTEKSQV